MPQARSWAARIFNLITSRTTTTRSSTRHCTQTSAAEHLRDYTQLLSEIEAGTLPHVVYYKPQGNLNQHPGYANADDGDAHIGELVDKLRAGSQWAHMVIVIAYDEYGGQWDHVAPPKGDKYGPGTRIPALIISPYAKAGHRRPHPVRHRPRSRA